MTHLFDSMGRRSCFIGNTLLGWFDLTVDEQHVVVVVAFVFLAVLSFAALREGRCCSTLSPRCVSDISALSLPGDG